MTIAVVEPSKDRIWELPVWVTPVSTGTSVVRQSSGAFPGTLAEDCVGNEAAGT